MESWRLGFTSSHYTAHVVQLLRFQLFDVVHKIFPVKEVTHPMFDLSIASWSAGLHSKCKAQIYNLTHYNHSDPLLQNFVLSVPMMLWCENIFSQSTNKFTLHFVSFTYASVLWEEINKYIFYFTLPGQHNPLLPFQVFSFINAHQHDTTKYKHTCQQCKNRSICYLD